MEGYSFALGQTVEVKRHGPAKIIALPSQGGSQHQGRYQVQYLDTGKTYFCRPDALRALQYPPQRVLVCETTKHYRAAALTFSHPTDVVLEVGCADGETTHILHQRCQWVLGIDKSWEPLSRALAKYPQCRLEKLDGFDVAALKARSPTGSYDKIFIDIGGIAQLHVVMGLLGLYYRTFKGTYLIVKSKYLTNMMGRMQVWVPPGQQRRAAAAAGGGGAAAAAGAAVRAGGGVAGAAAGRHPGRVALQTPQQQQQQEEQQQQAGAGHGCVQATQEQQQDGKQEEERQQQQQQQQQGHQHQQHQGEAAEQQPQSQSDQRQRQQL